MIITLKSKSGQIVKEKIKENITLGEAQEKYDGALFAVIRVEEEKFGDWTNNRACQIIANEGIGYAVTGYCNSSEFQDPITRDLWDKAEGALYALEEYIGLSDWEDMND